MPKNKKLGWNVSLPELFTRVKINLNRYLDKCELNSGRKRKKNCTLKVKIIGKSKQVPSDYIVSSEISFTQSEKSETKNINHGEADRQQQKSKQKRARC